MPKLRSPRNTIGSFKERKEVLQHSINTCCRPLALFSSPSSSKQPLPSVLILFKQILYFIPKSLHTSSTPPTPYPEDEPEHNLRK